VGRKYANPPILEAVCELRFGDDTQWDLTIPGLVYEKIKEQFPHREQRLVPRIEVKNSEEATEQRIFTERRMFFLADDRRTSVQVGPRVLAINRLKPYEGWERFKPAIKAAWEAVVSTAAPGTITRMGLRYINRIEVPDPEPRLEDYFDFRPFLGERLPRQVTNFVVGCVLRLSDGPDACRIQLADALPDTAGVRAFILDLDYFLDRPGTPTSEAMRWIEDAHTRAEEIFEGCITDRLRSIFEGVR